MSEARMEAALERARQARQALSEAIAAYDATVAGLVFAVKEALER